MDSDNSSHANINAISKEKDKQNHNSDGKGIVLKHNNESNALNENKQINIMIKQDNSNLDNMYDIGSGMVSINDNKQQMVDTSLTRSKRRKLNDGSSVMTK